MGWWLVGGLERGWIMTFHSVGNVIIIIIIPTDFFSEGLKPSMYGQFGIGPGLSVSHLGQCQRKHYDVCRLRRGNTSSIWIQPYNTLCFVRLLQLWYQWSFYGCIFMYSKRRTYHIVNVVSRSYQCLTMMEFDIYIYIRVFTGAPRWRCQNITFLPFRCVFFFWGVARGWQISACLFGFNFRACIWLGACMGITPQVLSATLQ